MKHIIRTQYAETMKLEIMSLHQCLNSSQVIHVLSGTPSIFPQENCKLFINLRLPNPKITPKGLELLMLSAYEYYEHIGSNIELIEMKPTWKQLPFPDETDSLQLRLVLSSCITSVDGERTELVPLDDVRSFTEILRENLNLFHADFSIFARCSLEEVQDVTEYWFFLCKDISAKTRTFLNECKRRKAEEHENYIKSHYFLSSIKK